MLQNFTYRLLRNCNYLELICFWSWEPWCSSRRKTTSVQCPRRGSPWAAPWTAPWVPWLSPNSTRSSWTCWVSHRPRATAKHCVEVTANLQSYQSIWLTHCNPIQLLAVLSWFITFFFCLHTRYDEFLKKCSIFIVLEIQYNYKVQLRTV